MNIKHKKILLLLGIIMLCFLIFTGGGYIYLENNYQKNYVKSETKEESVPYYSVPKNAGVMLRFGEQEGLLVYLNFEDEEIFVIKSAEDSPVTLYAYPVDYSIEFDYITLSGIIDRIGGIEFYGNDDILKRYTGVQTVEYLSAIPKDKLEYKTLITAIFKSVSENGFERKDFVYLIENSKTDLTVPDCYMWSDYIKALTENVVFFNFEEE